MRYDMPLSRYLCTSPVRRHFPHPRAHFSPPPQRILQSGTANLAIWDLAGFQIQALLLNQVCLPGTGHMDKWTTESASAGAPGLRGSGGCSGGMECMAHRLNTVHVAGQHGDVTPDQSIRSRHKSRARPG